MKGLMKWARKFQEHVDGLLLAVRQPVRLLASNAMLKSKAAASKV